jgi:LPS sulfotransferase NodH
MGDLQERLAELPGIAAQADAERLAEVLGDMRYVHVTREDGVAQAISLWRAVQTRAWRAGEDQRRAPVYSFAGIDHLVHRLEADDRAWDAWFERHGVVPLRLRYGEIAGDPHDALRRTLVHLGVADEPHDVPAVPPLRRQAGAQSREWAARYAADRDGA